MMYREGHHRMLSPDVGPLYLWNCKKHLSALEVSHIYLGNTKRTKTKKVNLFKVIWYKETGKGTLYLQCFHEFCLSSLN